MCGIFAYLNYNVPRERGQIVEVLFNGLRRLEHRGYDSAGISIDADPSLSPFLLPSGASLPSPSPLVYRQAGNIHSLVNSFYAEADSSQLDLLKVFQSHAGIAHTRWATHGSPSPINSHPQSSGEGNEFLVVHNGIITNYKVIKETLMRHGFHFQSETDTEVIPKLAKFIYDSLLENVRNFKEDDDKTVSFTQVVMEVMRQLEGAYALIFKSPYYPNELVACKRGSPLLLGMKETGERGADSILVEDLVKDDLKAKELFLASDANGIVEHTKRVLVIDDNEVLHIKDGIVSVLEFESEESRGISRTRCPASVRRALSTLDIEVEQINKGNFQYYTQKEIYEQPESLTTTMRGRLIRGNSKAKGVLLGGLKDHLQIMRRSKRIIVIGCGTSHYATLAAEPIMKEFCGVDVIMVTANKILNMKALMDEKALIHREDTTIFVSQSGETADTLRALEYAKSNGAFCVGITNTVGSAIARGTHCGVHINAGCEIGVASTKAYTSQIVVMVMMALALGEEASPSRQRRREAIIDDLYNLPSKVSEVLKLDKEMKELAKLLIEEKSLVVSGRGYNHATALECGLKLMELSRMNAYGIDGGDVKHGPLAIVDESVPIIVIATRDALLSLQISLIQQLKARKGRLIIICTKGDASSVCPDGTYRVIEVPHVVNCLQPVINIIPLQLLAYHLAVLKGFNVDQPRNLAKSVTTQ